jgi:hypothetical protein
MGGGKGEPGVSPNMGGGKGEPPVPPIYMNLYTHNCQHFARKFMNDI